MRIKRKQEKPRFSRANYVQTFQKGLSERMCDQKCDKKMEAAGKRKYYELWNLIMLPRFRQS